MSKYFTLLSFDNYLYFHHIDIIKYYCFGIFFVYISAYAVFVIHVIKAVKPDTFQVCMEKFRYLINITITKYTKRNEHE